MALCGCDGFGMKMFLGKRCVILVFIVILYPEKQRTFFFDTAKSSTEVQVAVSPEQAY